MQPAPHRSPFLALAAILAFALLSRSAEADDVDLIIALDNSASMDEEAGFLQAQLNPLLASLQLAGQDVHFIALSADASASAGLCAPAPLGSGVCPGDENLPGYRHLTSAIGSTNALSRILAEYPSYASSLRAGSSRHVLVVSDDDSALSATDFSTQLTALDSDFVGFTFHAIAVEALRPTVGFPPFPICDALAPGVGGIGQVYLDLAATTGGHFGDLCDQDFVPEIGEIANFIVTALAPPDPDGFYAQLDRAEVAGNASGGAGCSEGFSGGLNGWAVVNGDPMASGGFVIFQDPGELVDTFRTFYPSVELEREDIQAPSACSLGAGGGDATLTSVWVNHLPTLPGGFYGHQLAYAVAATPTFVLVEAITVFVRQTDATVAAAFGIVPGLQIVQSKLLLDATDSNDIVLVNPIEEQAAPITLEALEGATGQRIYLRLDYDEQVQSVVASYSLDFGATYQSPFTPVVTDLPFSVFPGQFLATIGVTTVASAVPVLSPAGHALLAGLLIVLSAVGMRIRASRLGEGRRLG